MANYTWWNTLPLSFDGVLIDLGFFSVRYYSLMYIFAFATGYLLVRKFNKDDNAGLSRESLEGLLVWVMAGIIFGARLGYVIFYDFGYYSEHIVEIFSPFSFEGGFKIRGISGMSYHGGLIGALIAAAIFLRRNKLPFWTVMNLGFSAAPLAYTWGRLGNFLNGELYGRVTDSAIGMLFQGDATGKLRHPSQLYEAFFEGIVLFFIIVKLRKKEIFREHVVSLYIFGYGFFRFFIEFFRQPDAHIGLSSIGFSRGQYLCFGMMVFAVGLFLVRRYFEKRKVQEEG